MASSSTSSLLSFLSPLLSPSSPNPKLTQPNSLSLSSNSKHRTGHLGPLNASREEYPAELMAVMNPAMANSNTLFFNSAYNVQVVVEDNEPEERLLGRFRREVMRAGVIQECKRRRYFENKQDKEKRKSREAAKRNSRRRRPFARGPFQNRDEPAKVEKKDDDGDNWEMPEGDAPF